MKIAIRQAKKYDIVKLQHLQVKLVAYERQFDPYIRKGDKVRYYNINKLVKSKNILLLVAEADKEIIGCGFAEITKLPKYFIHRRYGYIGLMYVDKNHRKRGIGKMIVRALAKWLEKRKINDIRLKVYSNNVNAIKTYSKIGFKNYIFEMRHVKDFGY